MSNENNEKKFCLKGEVFKEFVEMNGQTYEHIGFMDDEKKFGEYLAMFVGKRVKVCIEEIED